jgi:hypothetical protein
MPPDAIKKLFELGMSEREHLRRFIKWLGTDHFRHAYRDASPEGVLLHHGEDPNDIVDTYVEWLKAGEPE